MGASTCRRRAKQAVWWPGLSNQLKDTVLKEPAQDQPSTDAGVFVAMPLIPGQRGGALRLTNPTPTQSSRVLHQQMSLWLVLAKQKLVVNNCPVVLQ